MPRALRLLAVPVLWCGIAPAAHAAGKAALDLKLGQVAALRGGVSALEARATIEPGWHINAHVPNEPFLIPTELTITLPSTVTSGAVRYPEAEKKAFAFAPGKQLLVHRGTVLMMADLHVPADFVGNRMRIAASLRYQACNESTCAPPATATAEVVVPVSGVAPVTAKPSAGAPENRANADIGRWLNERGLLVTLLFIMVLGAGLNLTPCVYPLISVTLAYFGRQGHHSKLRVTVLALAYVLGITTSFAAVGVVASLSGGMFGAVLQKPVVLIGLSTLMVLLALSSFGLYQLRAPLWMQRIKGPTRGVPGATFMGLTMGVVAAPCIGPVVVGLLLFVGSQRSVVLGIELFGALGFGMGLPYVVLALAAGSIKGLPRSGEWLVWVERVFGWMLLGLAAYFLTPVLPHAIGQLLLPVLMAVAGVYLGFIDRSAHRVRYFQPIQRAVGIAAVITALWTAVPPRAESTIHWLPLDALDAARAGGQPTVIDFVADWCIPCHEMEHTTFADPDVQAEAERFVMVRADLTAESSTNSILVDHYQVQGVPTIILLDHTGGEAQRLVGYVGPEDMLAAMRQVS